MAAEEAPKGARRRTALSAEEAEEVAEIIAGQGADDLIVQLEYIKDVMIDDVLSKIALKDASDKHIRTLSDAEFIAALNYIWKRTAWPPDRKGGPACTDVCINEIAGILWAADEPRRQRVAKRLGATTRYQDWQNAAEGQDKANAYELLRNEKQKYVMRATRLVDAAHAYGLVTKRTVLPKRLIAVRGTADLNKVMTKIFLIGQAAKRSRKGK